MILRCFDCTNDGDKEKIVNEIVEFTSNCYFINEVSLMTQDERIVVMDAK